MVTSAHNVSSSIGLQVAGSRPAEVARMARHTSAAASSTRTFGESMPSLGDSPSSPASPTSPASATAEGASAKVERPVGGCDAPGAAAKGNASQAQPAATLKQELVDADGRLRTVNLQPSTQSIGSFDGTLLQTEKQTTAVLSSVSAEAPRTVLLQISGEESKSTELKGLASDKKHLQAAEAKRGVHHLSASSDPGMQTVQQGSLPSAETDPESPLLPCAVTIPPQDLPCDSTMLTHPVVSASTQADLATVQVGPKVKPSVVDEALGVRKQSIAGLHLISVPEKPSIGMAPTTAFHQAPPEPQTALAGAFLPTVPIASALPAAATLPGIHEIHRSNTETQSSNTETQRSNAEMQGSNTDSLVAVRSTAFAEEPRTLEATNSVLEIGLGTGVHGGLRVRAELGRTGEITASLVAANAGQAEGLHRDLGAMSAYLKAEAVNIGTLSVVAPARSAEAQGTATNPGGTNAGSNNANHSDGAPQRNAEQQQSGTSRHASTGWMDLPGDQDLVPGTSLLSAMAASFHTTSGSGNWLDVRV